MSEIFRIKNIRYWALLIGLFAILTVSSSFSLFAQGDVAESCTTICYVNEDTGDNNNGGASAEDALATIQFAVNRVSNEGEIVVASGTYAESVTINKSVTLSGSGLETTQIIAELGDALQISSNSNDTIIVIISGFTITSNIDDGVDNANRTQTTINDSLISGNREDGIVNMGTLTINGTTVTNNGDEGIFNLNTMTINTSSIHSNFDDGIFNENSLIINNSTISNNGDEGLQNALLQSAQSEINFTTIAQNSVGIDNGRGSLTITNSLVVNNERFDCLNITNVNMTIIGDNYQTDGTCGSLPQTSSVELELGNLNDNGGPTPTHALGFGSVAIDGAEDCMSFATDQRGIERPQFTSCDIGAYEATASITITKSVISGDTSQSFDFSGSFDFGLSDGESQTFDVSTGAYEFIELVPDGWTLNNVTSCGVLENNEITPVTDGSLTILTGDNDDVIGISVTIDSAIDIVCTFQNEQDIASLTVSKIVNWGDTPVNPAETFEICISGPSYNQPDCDTVGAQGGDLDWNNLIPGTYTVTETNPGNQWSVSSLSQEIEVTANNENTATITNTNITPQTGSLAVTKIVEWGNDPVNQAVIFEICITGPSYPQGDCLFYGATTSTQTWTDLQPGPYTVDEVNPVANWIVDEPDPNTAFFVNAGQTTEAYVTNTYNPQRTGSITANVNVDWNGNPVDNAQTFIVCLAGTLECRIVNATGGSAIFQDVPVGNYVVIEQNPGAQWTVSGGGSVTVTADGNATTSFNNVHDPVVVVCDAEADLSGWIDIGTTTATGYVTNNNSITCDYQIGMASYQMFDDIIDNQIIVDSVNTTVTLAPGEQTSLTVNLPACAVQVDLFYGETLQSLNGVRYGDRLLMGIQYTTPEYCVP